MSLLLLRLHRLGTRVCRCRQYLLLKHGNQAHKLRSLDLLGIEVVCFSHIEMADDILDSARLKQLPVQIDIVVELLVFTLLKVVHDGHFGRCELQHDLRRDGRHE